MTRADLVDMNGDGLVDIVEASGGELRLFVNLGAPGGFTSSLHGFSTTPIV